MKYTRKDTAITIRVSLYRSKTLKNGKHPVRVFLTEKGRRRSIATGVSLKPSEWNENKREVRSNVKGFINMKNKISKITSKINEVLMEHEKLGEQLSTADLIGKIEYEKSGGDLKKYTEKVINTLIKNEQHGSASSYQTALNSFLNFCKTDNIKFNEISQTKLICYQAQLLQKNLSRATPALYLRNLRAIYNRAIRDKEAFIDDYPFKTNQLKYKSNFGKTIRKHLYPNEISIIKQIQVNDISKYKDKSILIFQFIYYSGGINFIDLCQLKYSDIINDTLCYTRQKTHASIEYKMHEKAIEIINLFYKESAKAGDYIFPFLSSNQKYSKLQIKKRCNGVLKQINKHLKVWQMDLDIDLSLNTYTPRHTFASILAHGKMPMKKIQQIFGHTSITTTEQYIGNFLMDEVSEEANKLL